MPDPVPVPRDDLEVVVVMARRCLAAVLAPDVIPDLPASEQACRMALVRVRMLMDGLEPL